MSSPTELGMHIEHRVIDGALVLDIMDKTFEYPKTQVLKNHVLRLLHEGASHFVVLNLTHVQMLDSFGIAVFISILKMCKSQGGNLTMFGLNQQVMQLMELTRMDRVLDIWETEGQAIAHVKG